MVADMNLGDDGSRPMTPAGATTQGTVTQGTVTLRTGSARTTRVHLILFVVALVCQTVGTLLAVVDFAVFTISAQQDAAELFNSAMRPMGNSTTQTWSTDDWCVEMTNRTEKCLLTHSITNIKDVGNVAVTSVASSDHHFGVTVFPFVTGVLTLLLKY